MHDSTARLRIAGDVHCSANIEDVDRCGDILSGAKNATALAVLKLSTSSDSEDVTACMANGCNKTMPWPTRYSSAIFANCMSDVQYLDHFKTTYNGS